MENLPKINIDYIADNYSIASGTIMFISSYEDKDIGVSRDDLFDFMSDFRKDFPDFLYYGLRFAGKDKSRVHLDFAYCIKKENRDEFWDEFFKRGLQHRLYKTFGSAYYGNDVSFGVRGCYINKTLISKE